MNDNQTIINVQNLTKRFGKITAVKDVSIEVKKGEIFGFLGANGSGKTTTIRILGGLLKPDGGQGQCLGHDLLKDPFKIKQQLGYMTQKFSLYEDLTVIENLKFVAHMYNIKNKKNRIEEVLTNFQFIDRKNQITGTLSGGLKQRLALATSILHQPKLLLLDEPTAGVDPKSRGDFWEVIRSLSEQGITTLLSTHYMDEAEQCSHLAYMSFGEILIQGNIKNIHEQINLQTFLVRGENLVSLAQKIHKLPNIQANIHGAALYVSGKPNEAFTHLIKELQNTPNTQWQKIDPTLEEIFINLMQKDPLR